MKRNANGQLKQMKLHTSRDNSRPYEIDGQNDEKEGEMKNVGISLRFSESKILLPSHNVEVYSSI